MTHLIFIVSHIHHYHSTSFIFLISSNLWCPARLCPQPHSFQFLHYLSEFGKTLAHSKVSMSRSCSIQFRQIRKLSNCISPCQHICTTFLLCYRTLWHFVIIVYRGKFGKVCKCTEKTSNSLYAAKFIRVKASQKEEVQQEVSIMNELHHPKLLLLWDAFESARELILVMEQLVILHIFITNIL